jgi:hypothetical protein
MSVLHSEVTKEILTRPILIYVLIGILVAISTLTAVVIYGNNEDARREFETNEKERIAKEIDRKAFNAPLVKF